MNKAGRLIVAVIVSCFIGSCTQQKKSFKSPPGYNLNAPEKLVMKESLLEISGITFLTDDTLLAVNDEDGKVFFIPTKGEKNRRVKFGRLGDYEDVSRFHHQVVALRSNGTVFIFSDTITAKTDAPKLNIDLPKGDYESLYADETENKLYILCKSCKGKKSNHYPLHGYAFSMLDDSVAETRNFEIDLTPVDFKSEAKIGFAPSSLAKNRSTGEWYIISSVQKALLITDAAFNAKAIYKLDPDVFVQPEGIAFDSHHNLYISNEGNELQNGNVLKFTLGTTK